MSYLLGLGAVAFLALLSVVVWGAARARAGVRLRRVALEAVFAGYLTAVLAVAFLPFGRVSGGGGPASTNLVPFSTIIWLGRALPGQVLRQIGGNVLMFVPFGMLSPILITRLRRPLAMTSTALAASLGIEAIQSVLRLLSLSRRSVDVDDVILNVAGALLGYAVWWVVARSRGGRAGERATSKGE